MIRRCSSNRSSKTCKRKFLCKWESRNFYWNFMRAVHCSIGMWAFQGNVNCEWWVQKNNNNTEPTRQEGATPADVAGFVVGDGAYSLLSYRIPCCIRTRSRRQITSFARQAGSQFLERNVRELIRREFRSLQKIRAKQKQIGSLLNTTLRCLWKWSKKWNRKLMACSGSPSKIFLGFSIQQSDPRHSFLWLIHSLIHSLIH